MNEKEKFQGKVKLPPKAPSFDLLAFIGKATDHKMWINTGSGKYSRASWQLMVMATTSLRILRWCFTLRRVTPPAPARRLGKDE